MWRKTLDLATLSKPTVVRPSNTPGDQDASFVYSQHDLRRLRRSVTKALLSVDPQAGIETAAPGRQVRVESAMDESAFLAALSAAAYPGRQ